MLLDLVFRFGKSRKKFSLSNAADCMIGSGAPVNSLWLGSQGCVSNDWCPGSIQAKGRRLMVFNPRSDRGHCVVVPCDCCGSALG